MTTGSFFGELRQVAAFAAACNVAHEFALELDAKPRRNRRTGNQNHPLSDQVREGLRTYKFNPKQILDSYFESILLAGLLRTATRRHLGRVPGPTNRSVNITNDTRGRVSGKRCRTGMGRSPSENSPQPVLDLLRRVNPDTTNGDPVALAMLKELITLNTGISNVLLSRCTLEHRKDLGTKLDVDEYVTPVVQPVELIVAEARIEPTSVTGEA